MTKSPLAIAPARTFGTTRAAPAACAPLRCAVFVCAVFVCDVFARGGFAPASAAEPPSGAAEVEGVAAVVNGDIPLARDKAVDDAKRKAVEQVAGSHVEARSLTENFQLVEDRIYARASGFVKSYSIVSEVREQDVYRVKIRAVVDAAAVVSNLDQIFAAKPRVLVLVAEQNAGAHSPSFWWGKKGFTSEMDVLQSTLIQAWQPRGFKFVDPGLLQGKLDVGKAITAPELSTADALTLSKGADADIAIAGKVLVTDAGPVMPGVRMHSFQAVGTLRVLNVDTGEIIAVADAAGVATHIEPNQGGRLAIKALAQKMSGDLEKQILSRWTSEAASAMDLELVVANAKTSRVIDEVTRVLTTEVRGVEGATLRRRAGGSAFFAVRFRGDAQRFAREVESKRFRDFGISVEDVTLAAVKLSVTAP